MVYCLNIRHQHVLLTAVISRYLLTSITWSYRGLRVWAPQGRVFFLSWPLTTYWFSIGSRSHVRLSCWKQGRIVQKPVNANPGLTFPSMQMFFAALFCFMVIVKTHNKRPNNLQKTSPQSYKTQIKISPFPGLAYICNWALTNLAQELRF